MIYLQILCPNIRPYNSLCSVRSRLINIISICISSNQTRRPKRKDKSSSPLSGKLLLEINDQITYMGEIEIPPFCDVIQLKGTFERGQIQILTKTTSKLVIKLGFFKIEMLSENSLEIKALKAKIAELQQKLEQQWEEENLNSKEAFDLNSIYRVTTTNGYCALTTSVTASNIYFFVAAAYNISNSSRMTCSAGWGVTKIHRKR